VEYRTLQGDNAVNDFDLALIEMVREFGGPALYIKSIPGEYDPATGSVTSGTKSTPVKGILLDFTLQSNGLTTKYGTQILAGDKQFFMQPPSKAGGLPIKVDPVNDVVKVGTQTYKVVVMRELNPTGNDPILYEFVLRY
jgi:hypothetical protein